LLDRGKNQVLKQSPIFSSLTEGELTELACLAIENSFKAGEFVFWEGDAPEWFYVIAEGRVKVLKHASRGKEIVIAFLEAGEILGEVAVFQNKPYPASVQAVDQTRILGIKREEFLSFLDRRPQVALMITSVLGARLRHAYGRIGDIAGERVEQRLVRTLLMLFSTLGPTLPFTRHELADMSGTTTETAIRVLSRLRDTGVISSTRGKIIILDEDRLRLMSIAPPQE